jgi:Na+-driven multidrug efflux pump
MWMWLHTVVLMLNALLLAVLLSYKDTVFVLIASFIAAVFGYMTTFAGMNYFKLSADKFWFLTFVNMVFCTCLYAWRISRKQWLQPDFKSTDVIT